MRPRLSAEQQAALDLDRPVCLTAGAGSGKTGVLIERYLRAVEQVGFDLGAVLAVTFTKKAAAEVLARVRSEVSDRIRSGGPAARAWDRVRERLPDAWVMTIDAFCHRLLAAAGPPEGRPPARRILTGGPLAEIRNDAMRQVLDGIAEDPGDPDYGSLRLLLGTLDRRGLVAHLSVLLERRARTVPWADAMLRGPGADAQTVAATVEELSGSTAPIVEPDREQHALQVALARLFERLLARYRALLAAADGCDFRQLLEDVSELFQDERVRCSWAARFRHVLVDEFQDTDPLQWTVLRQLFGKDRIERPGLFVVGDEKQAIFSFRDGDVATFREARREIAAAGGVPLGLADNHRSAPPLVDFFNRLSGVLFTEAPGEFEATHAPMRAATALAAGEPGRPHVEILIAREEDRDRARLREFHALAARVLRFVNDRVPVTARGAEGTPMVRPASFDDQAILLRTRGRLSELEGVLTEHGIPFRVLGGTGFFERHEVAALCNLTRFLSDDRDDLALLGVLRSALFALPDSVLVAAAHLASGGPPSLWEKTRALAAAVAEGNVDLPTRGDAPVLLDAVARLARYRALAGRLPANELLALAVRESDLMLTLDVVDPSGRSGANVEKLLDMVRRHQEQGVTTLEALERALALARDAGDAQEAQADPPGSFRASVSILTVHGAKGLEWPIVFVPLPARDAGASQGREEPQAPVRLRGSRGLPFLHELAAKNDGRGKKTRLHEVLSRLTGLEREAEAKRLLYVAVTRARDRLVLTGSLKGDELPAGASWLTWALSAGDPRTAVVVDPVSESLPPGIRAHPLFDRGGPRAGASSPSTSRLPAVRLTVPATALATLRVCPRRFFLEHVIGAGGAASPAPAGSHDHEEGSVRVPIRESLQAGEPGARARGSAVHAALEGIPFGMDPAARVAGVAATVGIVDPGAVRGLEDHLRAALAKLREWPAGREILEAPPGAVFSELPFEIVRETWSVVGVIDLIHAPGAGGAVIVDFKTDRDAPSSPAEARELAQRRGYVDQLRAYAAAAAAAGRYGDPLSAWLFFTESGLAVPIVGEGTGVAASACMPWLEGLMEAGVAAARAGFPLAPDPGACEGCPHKISQACPGAPAQPGARTEGAAKDRNLRSFATG